MTRPAVDTLVLYSKLAFYPVHWLALEEIVSRYRARAVVLAAPAPELPSVHEPTAPPIPSDRSLPIEVRRMPRGSRQSGSPGSPGSSDGIEPDVVWVQEEPIDPFLLEILALYRFRADRGS